MKTRVLSLPVLLVIALIFGILGCWNGGGNGDNPVGPVPNSAGISNSSAGTAQSVQFRIVLPGQTTAPAPLAGIRASGASGTPSVTFKLTLVNVGVATQPTITISKTTPVDASGTAQTSFSNIPALTCIGDVHIDGGRIGSYSDFHGATDLVVGLENVINASPKNSGTRYDVIASIIEKLIADAGSVSKITSGLASRVSASLAAVDLSTVSIDQAYGAFLTFTANIPTIQTTEATTIAAQNIPSSGGTITVASPGNSLNGLEIKIPSGAFDGSTNVTVTVATISSSSLGVGFTPATPLIAIDNGGKLASEPVSIRIPITIADDEFAMAYQFDPATGRLIALPPVDTMADSFQIVSSNLGKSAPMASLRGVFRSNVTGTTSGIVVKKTKKSDILPVDLISTGFQPGVDDWEFHNYGSYIAPDGHCDGQSLTAMWYYTYIRNPKLFGLFDNNGQYDRTGLGKTSAIEFDDVLAYKFASVCHNDNASRMSKLFGCFEGWLKGDLFTFLYFKDAMKTTGEPQLVGLYGKNGKGESKAHAVLAYKATSSELYIADPNKPGVVGLKIIYNGNFQPYLSSEKADDEQITYDRIRFIGNNSNLDLDKMSQRWSELENGSIGKTEFPEYKLSVKNDDSSIAPLVEGFRTTGSKLVVQGEISGNSNSATDFDFWAWNPTNFITTGSPTVSIPLSVGENKIGIWVRAVPPGKTTPQWLDFKWFTIYCDAPNQPPMITKVGPSPLYGVNGSQITVTLTGTNFEAGMTASVTWKDGHKTLDPSQIRVDSATKAEIFIEVGAVADTWKITLKNKAGLESQPFSFQASDPVGAVADGFDYPIGNRTFQTERKNDSDGWFNATRFGEYYPTNGKYHLGMDWNADSGGSTDMGSPTYAVADGVIVFARNADGLVSGWGNVVIIRHQLDTGTSNVVVESLYGHLNTINVTIGTVKRGDVIGTVGDGSGKYPGQAHLHFEIRNSQCGDWGLPGTGYSLTPKPVGWEDPVAFIDAHRPAGTVAPPPAPLNVKATSGDGQLTITWNDAPGATSYNLYYGVATITYDVNTGKDVVTTAKTGVKSSDAITGLTNGTEVHVVVTAVGANGESQWSSEVVATPVKTTDTGVTTSVDLGGGQTMQFVSIPNGTFKMGSPATEANRGSDEVQHDVTVSAFVMAKTDVTQAQYKAVMGTNPSYFIPTQTNYSSGYANTDLQPVEEVSWYDAIRFANKVSLSNSFTACYTNAVNSTTIADGDTVTCNWTANGLRLPTEAEWEYACRANTTTAYYWGDDSSEAVMKQYAWYYLNCWYSYWTVPHADKGGTQPVGTKLPNKFGLYDMSGNAWEWCWDWYGSYPSGAATDPRGPGAGSDRVFRGGRWSSDADGCRSAYRYGDGPTFRWYYLGFRLLRTQ
ncbi:MAG: SUMF1/EgtB/PvdO family nonheme iron enzyme [Candidatus Riflebacteria bacterium]|nr:SUMF1/EgtB/PvdO family nonheme iron enzyme [Candidatus Riflebacteria bacterium]